jgi:hypothetical protein
VARIFPSPRLILATTSLISSVETFFNAAVLVVIKYIPRTRAGRILSYMVERESVLGAGSRDHTDKQGLSGKGYLMSVRAGVDSIMWRSRKARLLF